jgi:hypothetical protein
MTAHALACWNNACAAAFWNETIDEIVCAASFKAFLECMRIFVSQYPKEKPNEAARIWGTPVILSPGVRHMAHELLRQARSLSCPTSVSWGRQPEKEHDHEHFIGL